MAGTTMPTRSAVDEDVNRSVRSDHSIEAFEHGLSEASAIVRVAIGALALLAAPMGDLAAGQDRPGPSAEFLAGWVGFADDGVVSESLIGAGVRLYLRPRLGVGPEVVYLSGDNHSHLVVTGNVTWDLLGPTNRRPQSITPFFVVGGGLFRTREKFFSGTFTSTEGAFTGGGGVRALVGDRVHVAIDARVGWELHLRVNGSIGVRLGRSRATS
jgi:hypothetical protein